MSARTGTVRAAASTVAAATLVPALLAGCVDRDERKCRNSASAKGRWTSAKRFRVRSRSARSSDFVAALGPNANVIAVGQPCVAALAAVALVAKDEHPATPASLTLMAGTIDCRISPTA